MLLFALVLILALTSFGFTSKPTAGVIGVAGFKGCFRPVPCATPDPVNNDTPFIQNNLATVKVTPELAAALALYGQPAGTVVSNVSVLYTGTIPPYYEVTIVDGNYVMAVYIDARNGNILPPQYNHPIQPELFIR